jgi:hypothetical protein
LVPALFTFDIQRVLKLKKNNSGAKRLITKTVYVTMYFLTTQKSDIYNGNHICIPSQPISIGTTQKLPFTINTTDFIYFIFALIFRWIFRKLEGVVGTGWSWLRIGTGGGHLWVR